MRKIVGFLFVLAFLICQPITASANSLSYIPPEETDGVPVNIRQYAELIGDKFNICPELLEAMAFQESSFIPDVKNGSCKGLMQVNATIHQERFIEMGWNSNEWEDAYKNMYVAADYLHDLFEQYEDVAIVLYLYNGDSANLKRYRESGYLSYYVKSILKKSEELERLHGK